MTRILLILLFLGSFSLTSYSQANTYHLQSNKKLNQYIYQHWTTANKLPTNSLLHLHQSSEGYLWLTGYGGLIRFDGLKFETFNKQNNTTFKSNVVGRIAEDNTGVIWVTTQESGLIAYKKGKFKSFGKKEGVHNLYRALFIDSENRVWSASPEKGWFVFEDEHFNFIVSDKALKDIEVRDITQGNQGQILFATLGHGLFSYANNKLIQYTTNNGLPDNWIYSIFKASDGKIWIGTGKGIAYYENNQIKKVNLGIKASINSINQDNTGNIWVATNTGLFRIKADLTAVEHIDDKTGLPNSFINDIAFDYEGNLWMTNYKGGLTKIRDGRFINYSRQNGFPGRVVNSVFELHQNHYLIAFDNGEICQLKNGNIEPYSSNGMLNDVRIRHINKDADQNIWFSTYSGLLKQTPDKSRIWFNEVSNIAGAKFRVMHQDQKGNIWAGSRNNGLYLFRPDGSIKNYTKNNGLSSSLIMSISEDNSGVLYVGTNDGGINVIDNEEVKTIYNKDNGLLSNIIFNVYIDAQNKVWAVQNGGISLIGKDSIYNISSENGLLDDSPFDMVEDHFGYFWLSSAVGIMKIKRSELINYIYQLKDSFHCQLYNQNDGMREQECNATAQVLKASDGSLIFPTIDGITQTLPGVNLFNKHKPPVIIEQIKVNNKNLDPDNPAQIPPGNNRITFSYTALSLHQPELNAFKYKLEGYDEDWIDAGNKREVSYTNLNPGRYTFKVIACNSDKVWNQQGDDVTLYFKPRFVQTKAFYLILVLVISILIYALYLYRLAQLTRSKKLLERKVQVRTLEIMAINKELQNQKVEIEAKNKTLTEQKVAIEKQSEAIKEKSTDLEKSNKSKDIMFTIIGHDLRGPLGNFKIMLQKLADHPESYDEQKRQKLLAALSDTAKSTFDLLENLLSWSKSQMNALRYEPKPIMIGEMVADAIEFSKSQAKKKEITLTSNVDEMELIMADSNMVKTIFRNLISNAIKFTPQGGRVQIESKAANNLMEFRIIDNGIGMQEAVKEKLFKDLSINSTPGTNNEDGSGLGLILTKELVERNGGTIQVEKTTSKGTCILFTLKRIKP